jgi:hypothetical protein
VNKLINLRTISANLIQIGGSLVDGIAYKHDHYYPSNQKYEPLFDNNQNGESELWLLALIYRVV